MKFTALTGTIRISIPTGDEMVPAGHRYGEFQGPSGAAGDYPS
jgi:hypothetical protein